MFDLQRVRQRADDGHYASSATQPLDGIVFNHAGSESVLGSIGSTLRPADVWVAGAPVEWAEERPGQ